MFPVIILKRIFCMLFLASILSACTFPTTETSQPAASPSVASSAEGSPASGTQCPLPVYPPPIPEVPSYIPQELVDITVQAVETNSLNELLSPLEVGREVSKEELLAIMNREGQPEKLWDNLRFYVDLEAGPFGDLIIMEEDSDNDGFLDLLVLTPGGSAGNIGLMFFQGQAEVGYQNTYTISCFLGRGSYGFIAFEGKRYFWSSNIDYTTKNVNGLNLYEFQNGVPVEHISIFREVEDYTENMRQGESFYTDKLAQMTFELQSEDGWYSQHPGTAERREPDSNWYWGDLDNDGVEEFYFKNTWLPTTFWDVVRIDFRYEDDHIGQTEELLKIMKEHGYAVQTLWCDKEEQGNIVYTVSRDGGDVLSADAWQYQGDEWNHLAQILYGPEYTVQTRVYTQGLNIDYLDKDMFM